jgi:hypothetical protein
MSLISYFQMKSTTQKAPFNGAFLFPDQLMVDGWQISGGSAPFVQPLLIRG